MIVSFVVYFKTTVAENEGLAKLKDAVDNNKKLGNFTADALEVIQVNPTTAASNERSTGNPSNSRQKGNLTTKKKETKLVYHVLVHSFSSLHDYEVKLPVPPFVEYVNTQPKSFFFLLTLDASVEVQFQEKWIALP